jgi:hypothetical protein
MLEPDVIQLQGFKNVVRDGQAIGFQLRVRSPYYRGIWASLLEKIEVAVDGETFPQERTRVELGGTARGIAELADEQELRWPYEELATLLVERAGGLEPGLHEVQVAVVWRWSYIPAEMQPTTNISQRKLVLVY